MELNYTEEEKRAIVRQAGFALAGFIMIKLALTYIIYKATHNG
jgi:hypothetical protein